MNAELGTAPWPLRLWQERALLALAPLLLYGASLSFGLLEYDDSVFYLHNPALQEGFGELWTSVFFSEYQPVTQTTFWLDLKLGAPKVWWPARLQGLFWFVLGAWAVHAWLLRATGRRGMAFAVALICAVHPVAAPTVLWLAERKNQLCFAFSFFALERYLAARESTDTKEAYGRGAAAFALMLLALGSKIHAVALPAALLVHEIVNASASWRGSAEAPAARDSWRVRAAWLAPFFLLAAAAAGLSLAYLRTDTAGELLGGSRLAALNGDGLIVRRYLWHLIWPRDLALWYAVDEPPATDPSGWLAWLSVCAALGASVAAARDRRMALLGIGTGFAFLGLTFNVFLFHPFFMADHYLHWALPGWLMAAALGVEGALARLNLSLLLRYAAATAAVSLCGLFSLERVPHFASRLVLFDHDTRVQPDSPQAWAQHALTLYRSSSRELHALTGAVALEALKRPNGHRVMPKLRATLIREGALALHRSGQPGAARELSERECARFTGTWVPLAEMTRAQVANYTGRPAEAVALMQSVWQETHAQAARILREAWSARGDAPDAHPPILKLPFASLDPFDPLVGSAFQYEQLRTLAEAYLLSGDLERAWDVSALLVNMAPAYADGQSVLKEVLRRQHAKPADEK
ncbi:MAG: hypothetical protein HS116_03910 [Planctomycetes bacterium]|nr:hypothetical protein [Planctomycetota bacterium]